MKMLVTEPDVTFTDYGLALECAVFTYLLYRRGHPDQPLRAWFAVFFGAVGAAALAGGTVHGFFLDERTTGYTILWRATLIAIGASALAGWAIGARLLFPAGVARVVSIVAATEFAAYSLAVLFINQTFRLAVMNYMPAALFLAIALGVVHARLRARPALIGLAGLGLTFAAAGVQQGGLALHPIYFNHNALYHVIQAVALFMIFAAARWFAARAANE
jgi:hypothetical protein